MLLWFLLKNRCLLYLCLYLNIVRQVHSIEFGWLIRIVFLGEVGLKNYKTVVIVLAAVSLLFLGGWVLKKSLANDQDTEFTMVLDSMTVMKMSPAEKAKAASEKLLEAMPVGSEISKVIDFFKENGGECFPPDEVLDTTLKKHGRVYVCRIDRLHPGSTVTPDMTKDEFKRAMESKDKPFIYVVVTWLFKLSLNEDDQVLTGIAHSKFSLTGP